MCMPRSSRTTSLLTTFTLATACAPAAVSGQAPAARATECPSCAEWNAPQRPMRLFANVYFVGTHGLSAILITSRAGHVLIDGGLPESAPRILASIRTLGLRPRDVKLIVNSHEHYDHAGGISALQRATGARVAASPAAAAVLETGTSGPSDPQLGTGIDFPRVTTPVQRLGDGDTLRVGPLSLIARFTPGHTAGGTSWTWRACGQLRCLDFVYADSQTPVSADGFLFTNNTRYPAVITDFERSHRVLSDLACDVLITPHPSASRLWERLDARSGAGVDSLVDADACRRYATNARTLLAQRIAKERATP
jgi:metallo-beta-lactamase class B